MQSTTRCPVLTQSETGKEVFKTTIVPDSESPLLVNNTGHPGEFETKSGAARGWAERTGGRVV